MIISIESEVMPNMLHFQVSETDQEIFKSYYVNKKKKRCHLAIYTEHVKGWKNVIGNHWTTCEHIKNNRTG